MAKKRPLTPAQYQRKFVKERRAENREYVREIADMNRFLMKMAREDGDDLRYVERQVIVVNVGKNCPHAQQYHGSQVTVEDALKFPERLPPYEGCSYYTCDCDIDSAYVKPEKPKPAKSKPQGCAGVAALGVLCFWAAWNWL